MTLVLLKTITFFFLSLTFLLSISGFGKFLVSLNDYKKENFNFFELLIYGLILQTIIGFFLYITIGTNEYLNILLLIIGLFIYFFYKKKLNQIHIKHLLLLLILIFSILLISKTHEDFIGYHLFSINEIFSNQLRIGVTNLNLRFFHSSLLAYSQSLFILPYFNFQLIHIAIFFIYTFFTSKKDTERFFSIIVSMILLIKFNRLSEFGYDYISQFLLLIVFHKIYFYRLDKAQLSKALKIFIFSVLIKPISLLFLPIPLYLIFRHKIKFLLSIFNINKFTLSLMILILLTSSFLRTGCLFYPIIQTCFDKEKIFWSEKIKVKEYSKFVNLWAKNFYSKEKSKYVKISDEKVFLKNFNWLKYWIEGHFFYKISEFLIILILIILFAQIYFTREKPSLKKLFFEEYLIFLLSICSIFFWLITVPQFRFGFSAIIISIYLFFNYFLSLKVSLDKKKFYRLIIFAVIILNIKNLGRINNEIQRNDIYKFKNIPFYNQTEILNHAYADINESKFKKSNFFHLEILK